MPHLHPTPSPSPSPKPLPMPMTPPPVGHFVYGVSGTESIGSMEVQYSEEFQNSSWDLISVCAIRWLSEKVATIHYPPTLNPENPKPIESLWSKRFWYFIFFFFSDCILWPRHGHSNSDSNPLSPLKHSQWKIQFSQSLLIFSSLCGCFCCCLVACCMIRCCCCCCCWPTRKSVKS
ncbi:LOW QUALITY PROTEIN: uncharacterized protein LOC117186563 [Drosophila miranda]|uniref:LOW QUALITY PROTEIN: uncharacterized protein LOC117186563 n=1 Tax=Drosophila miranda TaxID=7229 RepID=UPI00143F8DED|nr:LOW QUALITY PROTEIN: uncharacterized protein LOC117186563 [Drosophila miranda]